MSDKEIGAKIKETQDKWLEHYRFGTEIHRLDNIERSKVQEHAMDVVRELSRSKDARYVYEKLDRLEENYIGTYEKEPAYWKDFIDMNKEDEKILSKLVELEKEKVRPLYSKLEDEHLRNAIIDGMDFTILVSDPKVTKRQLREALDRFRSSVDNYYTQRRIKMELNRIDRKTELPINKMRVV